MSWRNSREYRKWRAIIIRRDKKCQICGTIKNRQAHHLNSASYFKDQRFDVNNGVCLCSECHIQFHTNFKKSFRAKCTKDDFKNFKELAKYLMSKGENNV